MNKLFNEVFNSETAEKKLSKLSEIIEIIKSGYKGFEEEFIEEENPASGETTEEEGLLGNGRPHKGHLGPAIQGSPSRQLPHQNPSRDSSQVRPHPAQEAGQKSSPRACPILRATSPSRALIRTLSASTG